MDDREIDRLLGVEKAWQAVFAALKAGNPDCFQTPGITGIQCAVLEIERLQALAAKAAP